MKKLLFILSILVMVACKKEETTSQFILRVEVAGIGTPIEYCGANNQLLQTTFDENRFRYYGDASKQDIYLLVHSSTARVALEYKGKDIDYGTVDKNGNVVINMKGTDLLNY